MKATKLYKKYKFINFNPAFNVNNNIDYVISKINQSAKPDQPELVFKKDALSNSIPVLLPNISRYRMPFSQFDNTIPVVGFSLFMSNIILNYPIYPIFVDYFTVFVFIRLAFKSKIISSFNKEIRSLSIISSDSLLITFESGKETRCLIKDFYINREVFEITTKTNKKIEEKINNSALNVKSHINLYSCFVNGEACILKLQETENVLNDLSSRDICDYDMTFYLLREDVHSIRI